MVSMSMNESGVQEGETSTLFHELNGGIIIICIVFINLVVHFKKITIQWMRVGTLL